MLELPNHIRHQVFSEILDMDVKNGKPTLYINYFITSLVIVLITFFVIGMVFIKNKTDYYFS